MTCDEPKDILIPDTVTASPPCVMGTPSIEYTTGWEGDAVCIEIGSPGSAPASRRTASNGTLLGRIAREEAPKDIALPPTVTGADLGRRIWLPTTAFDPF